MLSEKKVQKLKTQYYKKLQNIGLVHKWKESIQLIYSDPTKGEFTNWMLLQLKVGSSVEDIIPTVKYFYQNRKLFSEQDINKYKNLKQLEDLIKEIESKKYTGANKDVQESERTPIWSNDEYLLVRINSKNASQKYGKGTKWCITMENASYYEQYKVHNVVFYFLLPKNSSKEKFAFAVKRGLDNNIIEIENFNARDDSISENQVPYYNEFSSVMRTDAIQQPKDVLPKLVEGEASKEEFLKFVQIYIDEYKESVKSNDKNRIENAIIQIKSLQEYLSKYPNSLLFVSNKYPEILYALSLDEASEDLIKKVYNKKIDNKEISDYISENISNSDNTPSEILEQLVNSDNTNIKYNILYNKNITSEILDKLVDSNDDDILFKVSVHPKTSHDTLVKLSKKLNISDNIKFNISYHHNAPKDLTIQLLREIISNANLSVIFDIAKNKKTPHEILEELARHNQYHTKQLVAENPNTPRETLVELSKNANINIKKICIL
jgi:hypothetical protein